MKKIYVTLLFTWITVSIALSNVRLPHVFSDNMVLQREMQVPVWGWADPGEKVIAQIGGHVAETVAGADGKWKLYIGPLDAGGPFQLNISGENTIIVQNVLVGEVWVCSGQSNMAMEVESCMDSEKEISAANYPQIRHFQVSRTKSLKPLEDVFTADNANAEWLNTWEICSPTTVGHFTGAGYFFGMNLFKKLNIPIGLIHCSWGGTNAEAWTPQDTMETDPELRLILDHWPDYNNDNDWLKKEYQSYLKDIEKAHKQGTTEPLYFNQPSVLYNGIVAPIVSYGIRGVAWYQGEGNTHRAYQYRNLLPAMIKQWREKWGQGNFPFLIVQLASYHFEPQVFPELREAQTMALSVPNTAMVVTIDAGDSANIHPTDKQTVGHRLFLAASNLAYKENVLSSGPVFKSMYIADDKCYLNFQNRGDGLTSKGIPTLRGFVIAGADKKFYGAQAIIKDDKIIVWSSLVPHPVAVRYAWANYPGGCNLYNKLENKIYLPASPFRTDDWPGLTYGRK